MYHFYWNPKIGEIFFSEGDDLEVVTQIKQSSECKKAQFIESSWCAASYIKGNGMTVALLITIGFVNIVVDGQWERDG